MPTWGLRGWGEASGRPDRELGARFRVEPHRPGGSGSRRGMRARSAGDGAEADGESRAGCPGASAPSPPGVSPGPGALGVQEAPGSPRPARYAPCKAGAGFHQPAAPGAAAGGPPHSFPAPGSRASALGAGGERSGDRAGLPLLSPPSAQGVPLPAPRNPGPPPGSGRAVPGRAEVEEAAAAGPRQGAERAERGCHGSGGATAGGEGHAARRRYRCVSAPPAARYSAQRPAPPLRAAGAANRRGERRGGQR